MVNKFIGHDAWFSISHSMADYIMWDIEVSSTGYPDYDPEDILVQSYDIEVSKCKSFFHNFRTQPTFANL